MCNRLRFYTRQIHGQCKQCNVYTGGGNRAGYEAGIIERYGQEYLDELYAYKALADQGKLERLTKEEVREMAAEHRRMTRELKGARDE